MGARHPLNPTGEDLIHKSPLQGKQPHHSCIMAAASFRSAPQDPSLLRLKSVKTVSQSQCGIC